MKAERVTEILDSVSGYMSLHTESQLVDYGESANGGPFVKLRLSDPSELEVFRGLDRATKTKQGHRYILMLVEVGDDDLPVKSVENIPVVSAEIKGGPLSKRAGMLCGETDFQNFVKLSSPVLWHEAISNDVEPSLICREYILEVCLIESRKELDHNELAAHAFQRSVLGPYLRWTQEFGR